jgi:hypothetical protein
VLLLFVNILLIHRCLKAEEETMASSNSSLIAVIGDEVFTLPSPPDRLCPMSPRSLLRRKPPFLFVLSYCVCVCRTLSPDSCWPASETLISGERPITLSLITVSHVFFFFFPFLWTRNRNSIEVGSGKESIFPCDGNLCMRPFSGIMK